MSPLRQHHVKSCGPGGLVVLHRTNYFPNPLFLTDTDANGLADFMSTPGGGHNVAGTPVQTLLASAAPLGGNVQRRTYTGVAGDDGTKFVGLITSQIAGFAAGEAVTASWYLMSNCVGATNVVMNLHGYNPSAAWVGSSPNTDVGLSVAAFTRFSVTYTLPATVDRIAVTLTANGIGNGDTVDLRVANFLIEKAAALAPYFDGSRPDCKFSGVAHESTSLKYRIA